MGAAGSPAAAFQRACDRGNALLALAISRELHQPLALELALELTVCFARAGDERLDRAAARWLSRFGSEREPSLAALRLAGEALALLPDDWAARVLRELARRR